MQLQDIILCAMCASTLIAFLLAGTVLFTEVDLGQELSDNANELFEDDKKY